MGCKDNEVIGDKSKHAKTCNLQKNCAIWRFYPNAWFFGIGFVHVACDNGDDGFCMVMAIWV